MNLTKLTHSIKKIEISVKYSGITKTLIKIFSKMFPKYTASSPEEYSIVYSVLKKKPNSHLMIDVGASTGIALEQFALDGWVVHAFEPDVHNRKILKEVYSNFKSVYIDSRAVSDYSKEIVRFYTSSISIGISSLYPFDPTHEVAAYCVETINLRDYIRDKNIKSIDFLKIDTEGHDYKVLKGFPWEDLKPRVIACEFDDNKSKKDGQSWKEIAELLMSLGYFLIVSEFSPITQYGGEHQWRRFFQYPGSLLDQNAWGNLMATREPELFEDLWNKCVDFENFHQKNPKNAKRNFSH